MHLSAGLRWSTDQGCEKANEITFLMFFAVGCWLLMAVVGVIAVGLMWFVFFVLLILLLLLLLLYCCQCQCSCCRSWHSYSGIRSRYACLWLSVCVGVCWCVGALIRAMPPQNSTPFFSGILSIWRDQLHLDSGDLTSHLPCPCSNHTTKPESGK